MALINKIGSYILVLLGLSIMVFVIGRVIPGDPARQALGPNVPESVVEDLRREMNLDKPFVTQYLLWLKGAVRLDLGNSLLTRRPVIEDVRTYLPATIEIVLFTAFMGAVGGILLGVLSTKFSDKWPDGLIRIFSYLGVVSPSFIWAILLMLLLGYVLPIFPTTGRISMQLAPPPNFTGMYTVDYLLSGNIQGFADAFMHLVLPSVALALGGMAQIARMTRSSMLENASKDYYLAEQAYGIPERKLLFKYLLKPSLIPTVAVFSLSVAAQFGNAFVVENIFNYPGISRYGLSAMLNKDLNAISGVVMILGIIFILMSVMTDVVVARLDPRIRLMGTEGS